MWRQRLPQGEAGDPEINWGPVPGGCVTTEQSFRRGTPTNPGGDKGVWDSFFLWEALKVSAPLPATPPGLKQGRTRVRICSVCSAGTSQTALYSEVPSPSSAPSVSIMGEFVYTHTHTHTHTQTRSLPWTPIPSFPISAEGSTEPGEKAFLWDPV